MVNLGQKINRKCGFCGGDLYVLASYKYPPKGETNFNLEPYWRRLLKCRQCGHSVNQHRFEFDTDFYSNLYSASTYKGQLRSRFQKIMSLPFDSSDNQQRFDFISKFIIELNGSGPSRCLDVGSGLGVFPALLKEAGWTCTALEPDPIACNLISELVGVETINTHFMNVKNIGLFDLITFNKVIEHVRNPVSFVKASKKLLPPRGIVYIEVPDGEMALKNNGTESEEFFIEHFDIYSKKSLECLFNMAGFEILLLQNVTEPSGKFTIRGFAKMPENSTIDE